MYKNLSVILFAFFGATICNAQEDFLLKDYNPKSIYKTPKTVV